MSSMWPAPRHRIPHHRQRCQAPSSVRAITCQCLEVAVPLSLRRKHCLKIRMKAARRTLTLPALVPISSWMDASLAARAPLLLRTPMATPGLDLTPKATAWVRETRRCWKIGLQGVSQTPMTGRCFRHSGVSCTLPRSFDSLPWLSALRPCRVGKLLGVLAFAKQHFASQAVCTVSPPADCGEERQPAQATRGRECGAAACCSRACCSRPRHGHTLALHSTAGDNWPIRPTGTLTLFAHRSVVFGLNTLGFRLCGFRPGVMSSPLSLYLSIYRP
mmetsp:Transcript_40034/g.107138  ORF Transcript_40034/g.107138 Transcript_40034/m.107138 type:complete len:274 (+) Transcript_40034:2234-3055(+)